VTEEDFEVVLFLDEEDEVFLLPDVVLLWAIISLSDVLALLLEELLDLLSRIDEVGQ
jgi:hypothetical protein